MFPNKKVQKMAGFKVKVEMKDGVNVFEGILESVDDYMNLHLTNVTNISEGENSSALKSILLRGNNIISIAPL
ncbi:MAG: LSM domain-containing protein [Methanosarcinaceae archaeon]|jgi:small nuclear ribonucleoprotein (snRNP)-like protein|nr:LSM domain-containing protein [Methanosarcinaceae archaeon]NKQ38511.1 LSM domain-containing protein [Methanosarcinales archaeon]